MASSFRISRIVLFSSQVQSNVIIFYASMMPCTKCLADPVIYGARMPVVAKVWRSMIGCGGEEVTTRSEVNVNKVNSDSNDSNDSNVSNDSNDNGGIHGVPSIKDGY